MSMKAFTKSAVLIASTMWLLQGCAANMAVPVSGEFWQDRKPVVGVALSSVPSSEVTLRTMYSSGMILPRLLFGPDDGDRDNEEHIMIEADQLHLERVLSASEIQDLSQAQTLFVERLAAQGFSATMIPEPIDLKELPDYKPETNGYAHKDFREVLKGRGLDRLIVLQVRQSEVFCHYTGRTNDFTEVAVAVRGEMVDLATNRLLWSTLDNESTIRKTVACSCERPVDKDCIPDELNRLFDDAAAVLVADFFANAPK